MNKIKKNKKKLIIFLILLFYFYFNSFFHSLIFLFINSIKRENIIFRRSNIYQNQEISIRKNFDYDYKIQPRRVCKKESRSLLVAMMITRVNDFDGRNLIRNTWDTNKYSKIEQFFIVGVSKDETINSLVQNESKIYNDILQADFLDTYRNLTDKTIMGIKWIASNCKTRFVLKIDDDVTVNIPKLLKYLENAVIDTNTFYCKTESMVALRRDPNDKWHVPKSEWKEDYFPMYCDGPAYIFTGDLASKLVENTPRLPKISLEDAYVGTLACFFDVTFVDTRRFYFKNNSNNYFIFFNYDTMFSLFNEIFQNKKSNL